jgi:integrase
MSIYFVKKKGWRYDFTLKGMRHTAAWFKTKSKAKKQKHEKRAELRNPVQLVQSGVIQTDITFLTLVNKRLDHVKAYNSERHYTDHIYMARRWVKEWDGLTCSEIDTESIRTFLLKRFRKTSGYTANKDLRLLRALFNFAMHSSRNWLSYNPTKGIDFFPVEKKIKYVPPKEDVLRVILMADSDTRDYLWTIALTLGRMSEINRLIWEDVNFEERSVILYTRKKRGGHLTPRKIPMCDRLYSILKQRYDKRISENRGCFGIGTLTAKKANGLTSHTRIAVRLCAIYVKKPMSNFRKSPTQSPTPTKKRFTA